MTRYVDNRVDPASDNGRSGLDAAASAGSFPRPRVLPDHDHSPRLCATCMGERHAELVAAPRARVSAALVADAIEQANGNVWPAINRYHVSYPHALRIRSGWRGAGRVAAPLPYHSRAWTSGRRNGWSSDFDVIDGGAA